MDTPGLDVESVTGMVGGGAQVVVFTTGLGTPTGNPIAPVIKITGNARTARQMADNIDLDVSGIMDDTETLDAAAERLFASARRGLRRRRRPPSGSATASSRSIGAIQRFEHVPCRNVRHSGDVRAPSDAARARRRGASAIRWVICGAAVLRRDHQLRRSAGHRDPQADAAGGIRLERDRLRRHRLCLPARLRGRVPPRRPDHGSARREAGFAIAIVVWSLAAIAHAEAPVFGPAAAMLSRCRPEYCGVGRRFHGGEVRARASARRGNFPAAIKVVAEWFPKRERAFATGLFNSGTNVGALVAPLVVPWITLTWGWYWAFVADRRARVPVAGLLAAALRRPPSGHPRSAVRSWRASAAIRRTTSRFPWVRAAALPPDLGVRDRQVHDRSGLVAVPVLDSRLPQSELTAIDLKTIGLPLVAIYLVADVGSIGGGWLSSTLHQTRLEP